MQGSTMKPLTLDAAHAHFAKPAPCQSCHEPAPIVINGKCPECSVYVPPQPRSFDNTRLPVPSTCSGCGTMYTGSCQRCMYDPSDDDWRLTMLRNHGW